MRLAFQANSLPTISRTKRELVSPWRNARDVLKIFFPWFVVSEKQFQIFKILWKVTSSQVTKCGIIRSTSILPNNILSLLSPFIIYPYLQSINGIPDKPKSCPVFRVIQCIKATINICFIVFVLFEVSITSDRLQFIPCSRCNNFKTKSINIYRICCSAIEAWGNKSRLSKVASSK